jgi:D-alanyl-D-alanine dipeptidase
MSTKITNIIGVPVPQWLISQLNSRANENNRYYRDTKSLQYLSNRTAWVRLVSSVNIANSQLEYFKNNYASSLLLDDPSSLAKQFILYAGTSKYKKETTDKSFSYDLRSGISNGAYGILGKEEVSRYGYQPMPGITSVTIESMGKLGSVRSATINFKVLNKMQLDVIDALYFKLGYTMFLEWGNTYYYETSADTELDENFSQKPNVELNLKSSEDLSIDPFENNLTKEKINYAIAQNVKKSYGNYDGMLGVTTNFNFSRRDDGSYDCVIKLMAIGILAESMVINRSDHFTDVLEDEIKKIVERQNEKIRREREALKKEQYETLNEIKEDQKKIKEEENKEKTINEYFLEKIKENPNPKTYAMHGTNTWKIETLQNYTYLPSQNSISKISDENVADIVYDIDGSWGIRKLGVVITEDDTIESITLNGELLRNILNSTNFKKRDDYESLSNKIDKVTGFISDAAFDALGKIITLGLEQKASRFTRKIFGYSDLRYLMSYSISGADSVQTLVVPGGKVKDDDGPINKITAKYKRNYNIEIRINKDYPSDVGDKQIEEIKEAIYNEITSKDPQYTTRNAEYIGTVQYIQTQLLAEVGGRPYPSNETAMTTGVISGPLGKFSTIYANQTNNVQEKYVPYIKVEDIVEVKLSNIPDPVLITYRILITDSDLIKDIKIEDPKVKTLELLKKQNESQVQQKKEDDEKKKASAMAAIAEIDKSNPFIGVNEAQKEEVAKYGSALEVILRSIQAFSLNKTGDETNALVSIDLKEKGFAKKILGEAGLYSTMYDQLFVNGNIAIPDSLSKYSDINDIRITATDDQLLKFYASYGFNHNLLSAQTDPKPEMLFNHSDLLYAYVIPHQVTQEFAKNIQLNRPVHIKLGTLLMLLNHVSLLYDVKDDNKNKNKSPLIYIDYNVNTNFCLTSPNHLSANPIDFLIAYSGTKEDYQKLYDAEILPKIQSELFDPKSLDNSLSAKLPVFRDPTSGNESTYRGRIMNILVDIQYLLESIKRYSKSDTNNSVYLKSFLESILSDMGKALGNYNIFRLAYNDAGNCLFIVDDQIIPAIDNETKNYGPEITNRTEIPISGVSSIAKTIEIKTDISTKLSNLIALSSNNEANQGIASKDTTSFGFINKDFTDRYIPLKGDISPDTNKNGKATPTEGDITVAKTFNETIKRFYGKTEIPQDAVNIATNYYLARMSRVKSETPASRATVMIPVSLNFSTDGISGFGMYHSFTISNEILPYTYTIDNKSEISNMKKVGFCVVGLTHRIENNQWTSDVRANMIFVKDKTDYKYEPDMRKPPEKQNTGTFSGGDLPDNIGGCKRQRGYLDEEIITSKIISAYGTPVKGKKSFIAKLEQAYDVLQARQISLKIGDNLRSFQEQKSAYENYLKNVQLQKEGKPWVKNGITFPPTKIPDRIANPCNGYHVIGQAVDLEQTEEQKNDILNQGSRYRALYDAGLRRISSEWWHWSLGEVS